MTIEAATRLTKELSSHRRFAEDLAYCRRRMECDSKSITFAHDLGSILHARRRACAIVTKSSSYGVATTYLWGAYSDWHRSTSIHFADVTFKDDGVLLVKKMFDDRSREDVNDCLFIPKDVYDAVETDIELSDRRWPDETYVAVKNNPVFIAWFNRDHAEITARLAAFDAAHRDLFATIES